jgi:hypothetical protein
MIEKLNPEDQELMRRAVEAYNQAQAILNFTASWIKDKYALGDNDKIVPTGEIIRERQSLEEAL